mmetsp:Transcript_4404/g.7271  ORF Transcript_4404/g.7271 Transcript_4404/m.7271 type:complete len:80 (-) Transcript_4404:685-924(-)
MESSMIFSLLKGWVNRKTIRLGQPGHSFLNKNALLALPASQCEMCWYWFCCPERKGMSVIAAKRQCDPIMNSFPTAQLY